MDTGADGTADVGPVDPRRLWSIGPGAPRLVRVRYPRFGWHFGHSSRRMVNGAFVQMGVGALLLVLTHGLPQHADQTGAVVGTGLLVRGGYRLIRAQRDRRSPLTITGTVLSLEVWRTRPTGRATPPRPWCYYLTVDSGQDRTAAWALPAAESRRCHIGDRVQLTVLPWNRRVIGLRVLKRAGRRRVRRWSLTERHYRQPSSGATYLRIDSRAWRL